MIVIFDLDDTLYDESSFVGGGFEAVATILENEFEVRSTATKRRLFELSEKYNRKNIFDRFLVERQLYSKKLVNRCIKMYRGHEPKIEL